MNVPLLPTAVVASTLAAGASTAQANGGLFSAGGIQAGLNDVRDRLDPTKPLGQVNLTLLVGSGIARAVGINPRVRLGKWSFSVF